MFLTPAASEPMSRGQSSAGMIAVVYRFFLYSYAQFLQSFRWIFPPSPSTAPTEIECREAGRSCQ